MKRSLCLLDSRLDHHSCQASVQVPKDNMCACQSIHRFAKLPPWVHVLLTGRPQIEPAFACWKPRWLHPDDADNQRDMRAVLHWRLEQGRMTGQHAGAPFVSHTDLAAATGLLQRRSEVSCLEEGCVKWAFVDFLCWGMWVAMLARHNQFTCSACGACSISRQLVEALCSLVSK